MFSLGSEVGVLKMDLNLEPLTFRGSATASRLKDKNSYNKVTCVTTI